MAGILYKDKILDLISKEALVISPLLEKDQIGEISTDLRIGTDFLSMQMGRDPYIDTSFDNNIKRPISSFYTETRRQLGEYFLLHTGQPVLFSTLEYIKLPDNIYCAINLRSSFSRLGLAISTIVQPGYCGCFSIELVNNGQIPIKLVVGSRIIQARFIEIEGNANYFNKQRKYSCQVRPLPSKVGSDPELDMLNKIFLDQSM